MGVDRLLAKLDGRTVPAGTHDLQEYSVQVKLAKALIEALGNYKAKHPDFPHQSTGNQFFTESQFESYRALGQHVLEEVFEDAMDGVDAVDLADPDAALAPVAVGAASAAGAAGAAGSGPSRTGAFGGNERRMDS